MLSPQGRTPGPESPPGRAISPVCQRGPRARAVGPLSLLAMGSLLVLVSGCARMPSLVSRTAPGPGETWTPPPSTVKPAAAPPPSVIPPELVPAQKAWTLADLVDIALLNSSRTRASWAAARSASAGLDIARAAFFPDVEVNVTGTKTKGSAIGGKFVFDYSSLMPAAGLTYLLLDLGGRKAAADEARQALYAANWAHDSAVQGVILAVEQSYYQFVTVKALLEADRAALKEASANLDAASERHKAGVATIADVLMAKTALSQAQLNVVSAEGLLEISRGALASAMGLTADTPFDIADGLPAELPLERASAGVEKAIAEAQSLRPDLAAARAQVIAAQARVRAVRSDGFPTLVAGGTLGKIWYLHNPTPSNSLTLTLTLNIPVSVGIANQYRVLQARADEEASAASMEETRKQVILDVWTSYFNLKTAGQKVVSARDLYDAAEESYKVALERYKQGVGSILDLLSAQAGLEDGRVQLIQAKADWLVSLVLFAYNTGTIARPRGASPAAPKKGDDLP
jgi:outer membrane protein